jgi:hypothetical protein
MIGFRGEKLMKQRKVQPLKDEGKAVVNATIDSYQGVIDRMIKRSGDRMLGKEKLSTSIPAVSGGRPESNRRKF